VRKSEILGSNANLVRARPHFGAGFFFFGFFAMIWLLVARLVKRQVETFAPLTNTNNISFNPKPQWECGKNAEFSVT
jgi:hypothetical protein